MPKSEEGWGCFLFAAMAGTILIWIWQGITWPFRVIARWIRSLFALTL